MADQITPSPHAEGAKALVEKIRALRADIPRFVVDEPKETRSLVSRASLSDPFLESASTSSQKSPRLEAASGTDATSLRDSFAFALSYEAALTEAYAFARSLAHTIRVARAAAGESALDIYAMAQRMAKRKDGVELVSHVQDMRRKLKRGRRKATSEPAPDTSVKTTPKQQ